ncbi:SDR family oxidoreductase [Weissella diestrammenae]|uniref:SDR family oxidoreductase n=1 Tax=Weissella diestrammenae TaxID=1162633 RepID=A0A7G9T6L9_9LACO|nr:SDR family oxidoreductase [Weissella diestrammenae]MCM0582975.1 SDR family oxidoreductase [Weissella diestrammenae]QNN75744.1 SDR family oxidoreductase [Weissella diestrammenae]
MTDRLMGKVFIVTGGSKGIGFSTAKRFLEEGAKGIITGRGVPAGEEAAEALAKVAGADHISFVQHDSSDEQGWIDLFKNAEAQYGQISILVNNAGIALNGNIETVTFEDWRKIQAVNLDGVFLGTHYGVLNMKGQKDASIINMSSIEGLVGEPNLLAYNASKGGVRLMTKSAALHCALNDLNVRINTVHPGYIRTPMVENAPGLAEYQASRAQTPMGHLGDPDDIANMCVFLGSEEAKFATGAEFIVDGGYTAK